MGPNRRHFLGSGAALASMAVGSRRGWAQARSSTLRFIPQADLGSLDPILTTSYAVRNYGYMVFDTLYAMDSGFRVRPQMAEGHEVSDGGLTWTIRLREGLRFHDGTPVRAQDCVASIRRWGARDGLGQSILALTNDMPVLDDRTWRVRLKAPFPLLADALGKASTPVPFIMPERIAVTDPATAIREAVGSGPFRFLRDEWVSGSSAAFAKFDGYQPRQEQPDGTAGGKMVHVDRVEWRIMPDAATAAAALQSGEVDWYEQMDLNLVPLLRRARGVVVGSFDSGTAPFIRFNHVQPPFNDQAVRRAVMAAVEQSDYLMAMAGEQSLFQTCKSFFFCGTPMSTGAGSEAMVGNLDQAKRTLAGSGYKGEMVRIISPTDLPYLHAAALVTEDLLRRLGMAVELSATDTGTFFARRNSAEPVSQGGWSIFHSGPGAADTLNPAFHIGLRGNGRRGWPGWPTDPTLEALRQRWIDAPDEAARSSIAADEERHCFATVPYVPLGVISNVTGHRANISGLVKASAALAWNLRKA